MSRLERLLERLYSPHRARRSSSVRDVTVCYRQCLTTNLHFSSLVSRYCSYPLAITFLSSTLPLYLSASVCLSFLSLSFTISPSLSLSLHPYISHQVTREAVEKEKAESGSNSGGGRGAVGSIGGYHPVQRASITSDNLVKEHLSYLALGKSTVGLGVE